MAYHKFLSSGTSQFRVRGLWEHSLPVSNKLKSRHGITKTHPIFLLASFLALVSFGLAFLAFDEYGDFRTSQPLIQHRAGNSSVANDLYGLGVRIGIYTQVIGMLLSAACVRVGGIKIACSASMVALLSSWTVLASRKEFSPCEAFLVISLISAVSIGGMVAASLPDLEGGLGGIVLGIANIWALIISLWFWATLYKQLPRYGTSNSVWFFTRVRVNGWFRILMLVNAALTAVITVLTSVTIYASTLTAIRYAQRNGISEADKKAIETAIEEAEANAWISAVVGAAYLVLSIAGVEMIIRYNHLRPETALSLPGQTIPLAIGVIVLADGVFNVILAAVD